MWGVVVVVLVGVVVVALLWWRFGGVGLIEPTFSGHSNSCPTGHGYTRGGKGPKGELTVSKDISKWAEHATILALR